MKRCPQCNRVETDNTLAFCRADGTALVNDSIPLVGEARTERLGSDAVSSEIETSILPHVDNSRDQSLHRPTTALPAMQTPGTTHELSKPKRRKVKIVVTLLFAAAAAAAIVVGGYFYYSRKSNTAIESIAVLPFENRSGSADTDYLSDGLADSLIYRLSQLPNLKVSPTSSVMRYKGKETDVAQIAKELKVDAVMSGRLVQRGDDLSISVQLIDSRTEKLIWAEQYDRKMADLLATQREIATTITQKLELKLSGDEAKGITKKYTTSNEAYQLYLKGRFHFAKRTTEDMLKGIEYFQQAIKLDPNFALAYVGIADSYNVMPAYPYALPKDAMPQGKAAAIRALEIDPTLAEAHAALASSLVLFDWKWTESESEFKRAIELNQNIANIHYFYGLFYLAPVGRHDEAISEIKRAIELEPFNLSFGANFPMVYRYARQNAKALEQAKKAYDLEPNFPAGRSNLGWAYIANGMYADAITLSEKPLQTDPANQLMLMIAGYAYAKSGRRQEAEAVIKRFREIAKTEYVISYFVASIYAGLGDKDKAFAELEKAFGESDWNLHRLKGDPAWDPLRDDPRFKEMLKRLNLPQ